MAYSSPLELFCDRPAVVVARDLLGARLMLAGVGGMIVETEAYAVDDPASHSFGGLRTRNASMFGPPARAYVYRSYGIHWCFNVVCSAGSAALVRALEPAAGLERMMERRGTGEVRALASGPGKLAQALGIKGIHDGLPLDGSEGILLQPAQTDFEVASGPRIGISKAVDKPWRFGVAGSPFLSRPFPRKPAS